MKPHVKARRERNLEIGKVDAANRCAYCRRGLDGSALVDWSSSRKFCSEDCMDALAEREAAGQERP